MMMMMMMMMMMHLCNRAEYHCCPPALSKIYHNSEVVVRPIFRVDAILLRFCIDIYACGHLCNRATQRDLTLLREPPTFDVGGDWRWIVVNPLMLECHVKGFEGGQNVLRGEHYRWHMRTVNRWSETLLVRNYGAVSTHDRCPCQRSSDA